VQAFSDSGSTYAYNSGGSGAAYSITGDYIATLTTVNTIDI
jgi:hypothetical protein